MTDFCPDNLPLPGGVPDQHSYGGPYLSLREALADNPCPECGFVNCLDTLECRLWRRSVRRQGSHAFLPSETRLD